MDFPPANPKPKRDRPVAQQSTVLATYDTQCQVYGFGNRGQYCT